MVLHVEGELLQEGQATLRARPAGALLARAREPVQDRIVEIGPLFREAALVPVHHRERRQHHRVAGEPPDLGPALERGGQLRTMSLCLVRAVRVQGPAPPPQEHRDRLVLQGLDARMLEIWELSLAGVGVRPAGHDEPRAGIGLGHGLYQPTARLARGPVGYLIETIEEDAGPGLQPRAEEPGSEPPTLGLTQRCEVMEEPGGALGRGRLPRRAVRPDAGDVLGEVHEPHQDREGRVQDPEPALGGVRDHPDRRLGEGMGDAAQEGALARSWVPDHHRPATRSQDGLQGDQAATARLEVVWDSLPRPARPRSGSCSATPAVLKGMYSSSMGKRCALPVPICRPRMSM